VGEVPDLRAFADLARLVDEAALVDEVGLLGHHSLTGWPFPAIDRWQASSTRSTRRPLAPSVRGGRRERTHSTKWASSSRRGSVSGKKSVDSAVWRVTGRPSFHSMPLSKILSLPSLITSSKTAIFLLPTTTSFCSLKGCSQLTKMWARALPGKDRQVMVTSATSCCR